MCVDHMQVGFDAHSFAYRDLQGSKVRSTPAFIAFSRTRVGLDLEGLPDWQASGPCLTMHVM